MLVSIGIQLLFPFTWLATLHGTYTKGKKKEKRKKKFKAHPQDHSKHLASILDETLSGIEPTLVNNASFDQK